LVEQRIRNAKVASSIPAAGTSKQAAPSDGSRFHFQYGVTPGSLFGEFADTFRVNRGILQKLAPRLT